jgi:uncharacterized protein with PQ loop repeat
MVDVKTKQVNGHPSTGPVRGIVNQAAEVTVDVIELAELQIQLVKTDAADSLRIAIRPMFFVGIGGLLMLASFPILLFAIAGFLKRYTDLPLELAQLIVGIVALLVAIITASVSVQYLKSSLTPFGRSIVEFKHNIAWLKTIFRSTNS